VGVQSYSSGQLKGVQRNMRGYPPFHYGYHIQWSVSPTFFVRVPSNLKPRQNVIRMSLDFVPIHSIVSNIHTVSDLLVPVINHPDLMQSGFPTTMVLAVDELRNSEILDEGIQQISKVRNILDSHYISFFFRQNLYATVLSESHIMTGLQHIFTTNPSLKELYIFYSGIFTCTFVLFLKDLSYKKKIDKLLENGVISRRTTRAIEVILLIGSIVLFKDVDVATG
jgi:hypothetical protein